MNNTAPADDFWASSPYGYVPTGWLCIAFIILFAATTLAHTAQAVYYRMWWLLPTITACGIGEIIGWSGRYWSSRSPLEPKPFLMQICSTVIAPSFMTAAMFIIFGRVIMIVGPEYSRLSPSSYSRIFITADVAALLVQAIGGAGASVAKTQGGTEIGAHVMLAGIIIAMVAVTIYCLIVVDYLWHVSRRQPVRNPPPSQTVIESPNSSILIEKMSILGEGFMHLTPEIRSLLLGLGIATVLIYIRSIYRTIELLGGWYGKLFRNQGLFNTLDGTPMFFAMFMMNIFHPGRYVPTGKERNAPVLLNVLGV